VKFGIRKPNYKARLKARTTGKLKRQVKKAVNPLYGKKGMGFVKNPKKSIENAVYHRTTVGAPSLLPKSTPQRKSAEPPKAAQQPTINIVNTNANANVNNNANGLAYVPKKKWVAFFLCLFFGYFGVHRFYVHKTGTGILWLFTFGLGGIGWLVDLVMILVGAFRDNMGSRLSN
jgi:hypothetical protein